MPEFKPIPIGVENFKRIIDNGYYYVDKTLMIKDIIDKKATVNLYTRPRRFGKTLNMSMIQHYFEKTDTDNSYLFENLNIGRAGEKYKQYRGQYPVINLSLKSMKQPTFEYAFEEYRNLITSEFERHRYILESDKLPVLKKQNFEKIYNGTADKSMYITAVRLLSDCLCCMHQKNVIILIDEYDVPIENAHTEGFYNEMIKLIRSAFESALKTNASLEFAILTGCLRVSKESIFTGLNNLNVYSVMNDDFAEYFGFTENEVMELTEYYNISNKFDEMKLWYDGYMFGSTDIYNPWSVLKYIQLELSDKDRHLPEAYWANTSSNSIIHELIVKSDRKIRDDIDKLVTGGSIDKPLYNDITYVNMNIKSDCVWSFLLHTGYLKPIKLYQKGDYIYFSGVVPNREVRTIYESTFKEWFDESVRESDKSTFFNAVINGDAETFELEVNRWLLKSISYHDGYENFYHGFLAGLLEYSDEYLVESNRESGIGRSDIIVKDILRNKKAVIIEIKTAEDIKTLEEQCDTAIKQIEEKQYESSLETEGYKEIIKYGVAFNGKRCMIKKA